MRVPSPQDDIQIRDNDTMETATGSGVSPFPESRSSEADAGLDDGAWFENDSAIDSDLDRSPLPREITMTDLEAENPGTSISITSSELSDLNTPGDVDIEDLDEDDLSDTDLPPDARLDPLEP